MKNLITIFLFACMFQLVACSQLTDKPDTQLSEAGWDDHVKILLYNFLKHPAQGRQVAIFDWDNTMIKNDIGDAVMFWMLANNQIQTPTSWQDTSRHLSKAALAQLNKHCPLKGKVVLTSSRPDCAETILAIYSDGRLSDKRSAWDNKFHADHLEPAYAWAVHLGHGHTPDELRSMTKAVLDFQLGNVEGTTQKIGRREVSAWIRVYPQMRELALELIARGHEVWIVSASMQYYVEMFAHHIGLSSDHVIGVRPLLDKKGLTTTKLLGCGPHADGGQEIISYRQGKRCWINKHIFNISDKELQMNKPSEIVFGAGDSDTDIFFLRDARSLRLVIDRNKPEVTALSRENADGKWLIQPMFIK